MSNNRHFDEAYWQRRISDPDWYTELVPFAKETVASLDRQGRDQFHKKIRHFFEEELLQGRVALADAGPNLDEQRKSIDTIVIHHTSADPGYRLSYMDAVQLLNIYAPYYMNPTVREERHLKGSSIWSNHTRDGKQTFLAYHWLMRMDGSFERLLPDESLGWHAGNWDINRRSVGICLDNDYEDKDPDDALLQKLAAHIKEHYPKVTPDKIVGHCECREGTICPGNNFIAGWKPKLIEFLN
ncbi:MAG: hypothetical protein JWO96_506 [Candidatus Saccharibacteria bacterium]|nr:hypothetical protein [Candidatus Saccharibacteria bacterium]